MISQTAQYALRAIVCLALRPHTSLTTGQLAELTKVSPEYLSKVMQLLVRADLVTSKPGKAGGFSLKASPETLTVLSIVEAIDPSTNADTSPLEIQSYGNVLRPLHQRLSQIHAFVRKECSKIFIKDLLPANSSHL
jgi:Rrf2 family transcriptional regulator, nitric oxide-sensitive transcriptional repressor